jgi:hypothetical protein
MKIGDWFLFNQGHNWIKLAKVTGFHRPPLGSEIVQFDLLSVTPGDYETLSTVEGKYEVERKWLAPGAKEWHKAVKMIWRVK